MKKLHKTQWLELALDKKNSTRPYTTSLYRATNELVATDGHRLHLQSGLVDSPTYMLSNEDIDYPNYKLAMQEIGTNIQIQLNADKYKMLIESLDHLDKLRVKAIKLLIADNNINIYGCKDDAQYNELCMKATIRNVFESAEFRFTAHFSPKYLRDAFRIFEATGTNTATLNILDDKSALHIKVDDLHAVVMPMKA